MDAYNSFYLQATTDREMSSRVSLKNESRRYCKEGMRLLTEQVSLQLCFRCLSGVSAPSSSELHWQEPFPMLLNLRYKGYHTLDDSFCVCYCLGYFQCFVLVMCFVQGISHYSNLNCNLTKNINEKCVHYTVLVLYSSPPRCFTGRRITEDF